MKRLMFMVVACALAATGGCGDGPLLLSARDLGSIEAGKAKPIDAPRALGRLRLGVREAARDGDSIEVAFRASVERDTARGATARDAGSWLGALNRELKTQGLPSWLEPVAIARTSAGVILTTTQTWYGLHVVGRGLVIETSADATRVEGVLLTDVKADVVGATTAGVSESAARATAEAAVQRRFAALAGKAVTSAEASLVLVPAALARAGDARPAWLVAVDAPHQGRPIVMVDALTGTVLRIEDSMREEAER